MSATYCTRGLRTVLVRRQGSKPFLLQRGRNFATNSTSSFSLVRPWFGETTKYHLRKEQIEGASHVDVWSQDNLTKEELASFTKDVTKFLRFLKIWCDEEKRSGDWVKFVQNQCASPNSDSSSFGGLSVERDVYLTRDEIVTEMLENGYEFSKIDAIATFFAHNDTFHYPELAALFNVTAEDAYEFCMRQRATKGVGTHAESGGGAGSPPLLAVKTKTRGYLVRSYALFYTSIAFAFTYAPLSAYVWCGKMIPAFLVYYFIFYQGLGVTIDSAMRGMTRMVAEKTMLQILDGEDAIASKMKDFAKDGECLADLESFKPSTQKQLAKYRNALLLRHRHAMEASLLRQLQSVQQAEASMSSGLQEIVIDELVSHFKSTHVASQAFQTEALSNAVSSLKASGSKKGATTGKSSDIVATKLKEALQDVSGGGGSSDKSGLGRRISTAFEKKEQDFANSFLVRPDEAAKIRSLGSKLKGGSGGKADDIEALDSLYRSIHARFGMEPLQDEIRYAASVSGGHGTPPTLDAAALLGDKLAKATEGKYIQNVASQQTQALQSAKSKRLEEFAAQF